MTVRSVDVFLLRHRLGEPLGHAQWWLSERTALLVKVTAEDGTAGWGEASGCAEVNAAVVREFLGPRLVGQDPLLTGVLWEDLYNRSRDFGRSGAFVAALSAIDMALWDLKGRLLELPVSTLLGGARAARVEACATGLYLRRGAEPAARLADEARRLCDQGYRSLKVKVGQEPAADLANLHAVRRAVGTDVRLAAVANRAYHAPAAIDFGLHAAIEQVTWLEEPLPPEDLDGYAEVRQALNPAGVAIAGGETEATRFGFRELCRRRCVDSLHLDLGAAGGFTAGQQIAALASAFGLPVQPRVSGSAVALAATLHYLAALPDSPGGAWPSERWIELDEADNPLLTGLVPGFPDRQGALVMVPDGPGLGVDVDEARLPGWQA